MVYIETSVNDTYLVKQANSALTPIWNGLLHPFLTSISGITPQHSLDALQVFPFPQLWPLPVGTGLCSPAQDAI